MDTNEPTYEIEIEYEHRDQIYGCQIGAEGTGRLGVWDYLMQTITYRMDKQKDPTVYNTGNYIQYPVINHNGKEYKKVCVYKLLIHPSLDPQLGNHKSDLCVHESISVS